MASESSKAQDFLKTMVDELRQMAKTETVIGDPLKIDGKTIIPIIKMAVGFGAGGGEGGGETPGSDKVGSGSGQGVGMGGGGGLRIDPVAFIIMDKDKVNILSVKGAGFERLLEKAPDLIEKCMEKYGDMSKKEGKKGAKK